MKKLLIALLMLLPVTLWAQTTAEPYAVLSQDSLTVTFYYDDQKASRGGIEINSRYISTYDGEKNPYGTAVTAVIDESFANDTTLTSTAYWFGECGKLTEIRGLNNLNTANVTSMEGMFYACTGLTSIDVSGFNTANVTLMWDMFSGCSGLTSLDVSGFNTANVTNMYDMFEGCSGLTSLDLSGFNTANVTTMGSMFEGCSGLTSLDVSSFNTANVTYMWSMFEGCSGLTSLDVSGFNTANVTDMFYMFSGCSGLTSLDVSGFNTANVTNMDGMFSGCSSLTRLDVSGFNTANVTDMSGMFEGCFGLTSLDLSGFNTANVTDMEIMFSGCSGLTSLDVSSFNTANVTNMKSMFNGCSDLTRIYAGNGWSVAAITEGENMFKNCVNLIGGAGTAYDPNHTDHTYARIDGGASNPGYFTAKDGQDDPLLTRLYDNLALTTTDGNADGGNNDLSGSIDAAQTSLVRAMWNLQELPTDESYCVWMDAGIPVLNTNTWSNSTQTQSMMGLYARLYHGIILANNYLANQNDGDMGKQAEARFLRALQYYYLMDHFGNVPLLTDTIDRQPLPVWEATPRDIELPTRVEMFNYIESELQDCLNSLPATNSYGRATATAARLLLARLYLNSEVYTGTARWQEARSYAESVINGGTFQLAPIYRNLFMGDNDSNGAQQEIILPAIYDGNTRTDYGGTTFLVASSFTNGEGDNGTTQVWAGNVSKPDFVNKFFTQTADIPYASPEQTASAASDDRALFYGINHSYELRNGDSFSDGFPYQKFTNVRSNGTSPVSSKFADTDFPLMRLGEAYLIAAEADARLNGSATSMQGTQYINMLRNRANATTSTAGYSLSDICDEWSREMGYEAVRRTTLIRFGRFGGQADYSWAWKGGSYNGSVFEAEKNTYPIPAVEVGGTPEPYAVLSQDSLTVTFYYDDQKASRGGMEINSRYIEDYFDEKNPYGSAVTAVIDESFANDTTLTSTAFWFMECRNLAEIRGLSNLNTANVTDMGYMFYGCSGLTSLDVSGFNTANVTDMSGMFSGCSGLTSLDVSGFNTANVTDMTIMFSGCSGLTSLDVTGFNTANVTNMGGMFEDCSGLTSLDVSGFNTANVTGMGYMFNRCSGLTSLDLSGFNTANVTDMLHMFSGCSGLTSLDLSGFNTSNVTDMGEMFSGCSGLTSLDLSGFKTANVTGMGYMFNRCSGLTSLDLSGFNTANVTDMLYMFRDCSGLTSLDLSGFNTANVTDMREMFYGCSGLTSLDLSGFNTANVTGMGAMFYGCSGLTSLDLSGFNTANVTGMSEMFWGCSGLTSLDVSGFNTANVTDMSHMFSRCSGLTSLDLSGFNTANVTNMSLMFDDCSGLTSLDLSGFNTANVTDMWGMFDDCSGLTSLDLSGFNTANVTNMEDMFSVCSGLTSLDLSGFNTANVTRMGYMFFGCFGLTKIYAGDDWSVAAVTDGRSMFNNCTSLVGGAGTAYDANHTDHTYAHIDGGASNPGYFTDKNAPQVDATYIGTVLTVGGQTTMAEALQTVGRDAVVQTVSTIVWNSTATLTESDLQAIANPNLLIYATDSTLVPKINNVVVNGVADNVVLTTTATGNCNFYAPEAFTARRISYSREFRQQTKVGVSRGWESIALPFTVQAIRHETRGVIAPFGTPGEGYFPFWLRRLTANGLQSVQQIEANTAYIISMPNTDEYAIDYNLSGVVTFSAENAQVPVTEPVRDETADYVMMPLFQSMAAQQNIYALNVNEERNGYPEGSIFEQNYRELRPFEAYTEHIGNRPAPQFIAVGGMGGEGTTGIGNVRRTDDASGEYYDLRGRKLQGKPQQKGVYIQNGKKIIVK